MARKDCKVAGYPRKAQENKRSHTDSISPTYRYLLLIRSLALLIIRARRPCASNNLLIQEIIELTHVHFYSEAEVRSSSVSVVVRLRIVFSKAALQKRGSMEPMEPPLDPPLA